MDAKGFVHGSIDRVNGYIRFPFPFPIAIPDGHIETIWIDSDPTSASVRLHIDQGESYYSVECAIIYRNEERMHVVREYWNVVLAFLMTCAPKRVTAAPAPRTSVLDLVADDDDDDMPALVPDDEQVIRRGG